MLSDQEVIHRLLELLDTLYETDSDDSLGSDVLCKELALSPNQLQSALDPLLARQWIEKDIETVTGYFRVRLTPLGKEELDRSKGNSTNERIRAALLGELASKYEKYIYTVTDSDSLAQNLGVDPNKVCLNLKMMDLHGWVHLEPGYGVGHAFYYVSLTPAGKMVHDNPEQHLVFLSHAAVDEEIAKCMKELIERTFPQVEVFASSDPEDLRPSDPWIEKVLQKLKKAKMVLVLVTERGLSRRWVWFETGAGWSRDIPILPCCLGKVRKGQLPPPFLLYQAINVDEGADIEKLVGELTSRSGPPSQVPDYSSIASELVRLDVRAEEREQLKKTRGPSAEARTHVEEGLSKLNDAEKEAIRRLFTEGNMTDRRAIKVLQEKGILTGNVIHIFPRIASETGFVQRVWPIHDRERLTGYDGPWTLNPDLKPILETYLFPR